MKYRFNFFDIGGTKKLFKYEKHKTNRFWYNIRPRINDIKKLKTVFLIDNVLNYIMYEFGVLAKQFSLCRTFVRYKTTHLDMAHMGVASS